MNNIKIIKFNKLLEDDILNFKIRKASRAIVFDKDKNIGILYVGKYYNYFSEDAFNSVLMKKCATEDKLEETSSLLSSRGY